MAVWLYIFYNKCFAKEIYKYPGWLWKTMKKIQYSTSLLAFTLLAFTSLNAFKEYIPKVQVKMAG